MTKFQLKFLEDKTIEEWTNRLANGETGYGAEELSRGLLIDFVMRASFKRPQSAMTIQWLANAFDEVLDYKDPHAALSLPKRAAHRPVGRGPERAANVAWWVALAIGRGYPEPEANSMAAARFSIEPRSVLRMRRQAERWVKGMNSEFDWEEYFRLLRRPLPARLAPDANS